jgi:uncharacterized protein (DUF608 family)
MSCCGGKCGEVENLELDGVSRYPTFVEPNKDLWKQAEAPAANQFEGYGKQREASADPYTYSGANLNVCDFPLGGFGAGYVILRGDGTLGGFNVVNQTREEAEPMHTMPCTFFGVSATPEGGAAQSFVLASPETYTDENCHLPRSRPAHVTPASVERLQALPGIASLSVVGKYPVAEVDYGITGFPVQVKLEAMAPLIPGDEKASSLPAAVFTFTVTNPGSKAVSVRLLEAQQNFVGWNGHTDCTSGSCAQWGGNVNTPQPAGLTMSSAGVGPTSAYHGTLAVTGVVPAGSKTALGVLPQATSEADLWGQFVAGKEQPPAAAAATPPSAAGVSWCGGVVQAVTVAPGATETVTFVLAWNFPNRERDLSCGNAYKSILPPVLGNRYSSWFADAAAAAAYVAEPAQMAYLLGTTRLYRDAIFSTTIPPCLLDSAAGRVAHLRCPTMWWCADGTVMGSEGNGCCPLNCTHVYGYTTLMERLYPNIAKNMRESDFIRNFNPAQGGCTMRFGTGGWAIDGAFACIIKAYLVVQQADGDVTWLPSVWPNIKLQMQIIMDKFDKDADGCIRSAQQNTYDTSMQGANTFIGSYYVTALRASAAMATLMAEPALAQRYSARAELAAKSYDQVCWKEEFGYYIADVTAADCANSYGPGCFVDQLCCAGLSAACGFGYVFDKDGQHEAAARKAVTVNNHVTKPPWNDMQKHMFDGDDALTACTYPHGKLGNGMRYDTIVSTGFTSPNISGSLLDRNTADAELIAGHIRTRQDGRNRSPWNEPECNVLYSRAMAHWNIFDQACGFRYDSTSGFLAFDPRYSPTDFRCFVTMQGGWGTFSQQGAAGLGSGTVKVGALFGVLKLKVLSLAATATAATATLDGKALTVGVSAAGPKGTIQLRFGSGGEVVINAKSVLAVTLSGGSAAAAAAHISLTGPGGICTTPVPAATAVALPGAAKAFPQESAAFLAGGCCPPGGAGCCPPGAACLPGACCPPGSSACCPPPPSSSGLRARPNKTVSGSSCCDPGGGSAGCCEPPTVVGQLVSAVGGAQAIDGFRSTLRTILIAALTFFLGCVATLLWVANEDDDSLRLD